MAADTKKGGYRYKRKTTATKGRSFHKFLPQVWQEADLPLKQKNYF